MKFKLGVFSALVVALSGCANIDSAQVNDVVEKNDERIKEISFRNSKTPDVILFNGPYVKVISKERAKLPDWTYEKVSGDKTANLSGLMKSLVQPHFVNVEYRDDIRKGAFSTLQDKQYTISMPEGSTVMDAIEAIGAATGYGYVVEENKLAWQEFVTETFSFNNTPGRTHIMLKDGSEDASAEENGVIAQYDMLGDAVKALRALLRLEVEESTGQQNSSATSSEGNNETDENDVEPSEKKRQEKPKRFVYKDESTSSIIVKATPSEMIDVRKLIEDKELLMAQKVMVEVEVLKVEYDDSSRSSLDFDLIRQYDSGALTGSLKTAAATSVLGTAFGSGVFTITDNEGNNAGSKAFIEALEQQGRVTSKTMPMAIVGNNKRNVTRQVKRRKYIISRGSSNTQISEREQVTQDDLEYGFKMELFPNISGKNIALNINIALDDLEGIDTIGGEGQEVQSPRLKAQEFSTFINMKSGEQVVFSQLSDEFSSLFETKSGYGFFGFGDNLQKTNSETLLLVKATVL